MVILKDSEYQVIDTNTKELVSSHPFTTDYEKKKAKEAALQSNDAWKSQQ